MHMIQVTELSKNYGERSAISGLNFTVPKGAIVGFLGPNGAGKSTTMKILTGSLAPDYGDVLIGGVDIFSNPLAAKTQIGYLPEIPPLYTDMTVIDYLKYAAALKGVSARSIPSAVDEVLQKVQLEQVRNRCIDHLSKGYKQRVGIAQALVAKPDLLVLDEPTVGLDPQQLHEIRSLIISLRGQHTVLLSTHILSEVEATCDQAIFIHQGKIKQQGSLADLMQTLDRQSKQVKIQILKTGKDLNVLGPLGCQSHLVDEVEGLQTWVVTYSSERIKISDITRKLFESQFEVFEVTPIKKDLEELFLSVTQGSNI